MASHQVTNHRGKSASKSESGGQSQKGAAEPNSEVEESSAGYGLGDMGMGDMAENASEYVSQRVARVREGMSDCTRNHEGSAVLVSLGAGFGVGLMIGCAVMSGMSSRRKPSTWRDRITAEGLGRTIMDQIESIVPEALSQRFGK